MPLERRELSKKWRKRKCFYCPAINGTNIVIRKEEQRVFVGAHGPRPRPTAEVLLVPGCRRRSPGHPDEVPCPLLPPHLGQWRGTSSSPWPILSPVFVPTADRSPIRDPRPAFVPRFKLLPCWAGSPACSSNGAGILLTVPYGVLDRRAPTTLSARTVHP